MFTLISFVAVSALLITEGSLIATLILRTREEKILRSTLGYPLALLPNALLFFALHLLEIPFEFRTLLMLHVLFLGVLSGCVGLFVPLYSDSPSPQKEKHADRNAVLKYVCTTLLALTVLTAALYALTLPTLYQDSFSQWSMRSYQSLHAGFFVIENVKMPHYPVLLHSLHLMQTALPGWNDLLINISTSLLSLSIYVSLFLLIQKRYSRMIALATLTLLMGIPLIALHLKQGMADIHLLGFALLSAIFLDQALEEKSRSLLLFSALLVISAAWTKFEGIYFCLLPWLFIVLLHTRKKNTWKFSLCFGVIPACILSAIWPIYLLSANMPLSPHGGSFGFHFDAVPHVLEQLFALGTFGLHWWAITCLLIVLLWQERKGLILFLIEHPILLWGITSLILLLITFLCTKEVDGLIHRHNFSRAMLLPTMLLTMGLTLECAKRLKRE